jgi:energy-coupling factor transport system substrate-specific component
MPPTTSNVPTYILAAACVALNVALGTIVYLLKLPIYLDSIGIMMAAILIPGTAYKSFITASMVGVVSFVIGGFLVNPFLPYFIGTAIAGAAFGAFVVRGRVSSLVTGEATLGVFIWKTVLFGVGWGIIAAIVSAPVAVYLFGGVTGSGTALIIAFLVKTGQQVLSAALLTGLVVEPIDKTLQMLCAILISRWTPASFRKHLSA